MATSRLSLRQRVGRWVGGFDVSYNAAATAAYLLDSYGERPIHLRRRVSAELAMQQNVVFACVQRISGAMSLMPLAARRNEQIDKTDAIARLWNTRPNVFHNGSDHMRWIAASVLYHGNSYHRIVRNRLREVIRLDPIPAQCVKPRLKKSRLVFDVWNSAVAAGHGTPDNVFDSREVLHMKGMHLAGAVGLSPIQAGARGPINSSFLSEEYAADTFVHGWHSPIITGGTPPARGEASSRAKKRSMEEMASTYTAGTSSRKRPYFAPKDAKVEWPSISASDQQVLEAQKWNGERICATFNLHPALAGFDTKVPVAAVYAQIFAMFVTNTLWPYASQWGCEAYDKLYRQEEDTEVEFVSDALTRGDNKSRYEGHKVALGGTGSKGFKSINDVRAEEGMPPKGDPDDENNPYNQIATATSGPEQDSMSGAGGGGEGGELDDDELMELMDQARDRGLL